MKWLKICTVLSIFSVVLSSPVAQYYDNGYYNNYEPSNNGNEAVSLTLTGVNSKNCPGGYISHGLCRTYEYEDQDDYDDYS